jgi:hypothetical protein
MLFFLPWTNHIIGLRSGQLRAQKVLSPLEKSLEMPHYVVCPRKKIASRTLRISGTLIVISCLN